MPSVFVCNYAYSGVPLKCMTGLHAPVQNLSASAVYFPSSSIYIRDSLADNTGKLTTIIKTQNQLVVKCSNSTDSDNNPSRLDFLFVENCVVQTICHCYSQVPKMEDLQYGCQRLHYMSAESPQTFSINKDNIEQLIHDIPCALVRLTQWW